MTRTLLLALLTSAIAVAMSAALGWLAALLLSGCPRNAQTEEAKPVAADSLVEATAAHYSLLTGRTWTWRDGAMHAEPYSVPLTITAGSREVRRP